MDANFIKVMSVLAEAGITPTELDSIIMPQMHDMMMKLERVDMNLDDFKFYMQAAKNEDELEELIENITSSLDT